MEKDFRPCGNCNACCTGKLKGVAYGNLFDPNRKCVFLVEEKCSIYKTRPSLCREYQCAWSENLLYEEMRPDLCGVIVTHKKFENKEFLEVVELWDHVPFDTYNKINQISKEKNIPWLKANINNEVGRCGNIKYEQL